MAKARCRWTQSREKTPAADNEDTAPAWEAMHRKIVSPPTPESLPDNHPIDHIPIPASERPLPVPKSHRGKNKLPKKADTAMELPKPLFVFSL